MKKRFVIFNMLLVVTVLFSVLFQSIHSYSHFEKEILQKKCEHKLVSAQEITHEHQVLEHCFFCEFTFSNYTLSKGVVFEFCKSYNYYYNSFFYSKKITQYFKGSLFSLRGPPFLLFLSK